MFVNVRLTRFPFCVAAVLMLILALTGPFFGKCWAAEIPPVDCESHLDPSLTRSVLKYGAVEIYDITRTASYIDAHKRFKNLTPAADYDPVGAIYMNVSALTYDGYRNFFAFVDHLPKDVKLVLYGTRQNLTSYLPHHLNFSGYFDGRTEGSVFYQVIENANQEDTIPRWARDHTGVFVKFKVRESEVVGTVSSNYRFNYNPKNLFFGTPDIHHIDANFEWGNFIQVGKTGYVVSGSRWPAQLNHEEFAYTGVDQVVVLPQPFLGEDKAKLLGIPHSDEFLIALSDDTIVTNDPEYAKFFRTRGLKVAEVPSNADIGFDHFSYTNVVVINNGAEKQIYMTTFSTYGKLSPTQSEKVKVRDQEAIRVYESLGYKVIATDSSTFNAISFGGIHCATRNCPVQSHADQNPGFFDGSLIKLK